MRKITYQDYARYLQSEGYSSAETRNLYEEMKRLDPQVRRWMIDWFYGGGYPADAIEGVTVQFLVEEVGMKPMNAFISMDWLKKDPEAAKYALTHAKTPLPMEKTDEMPEHMGEPDDEGITEA